MENERNHLEAYEKINPEIHEMRMIHGEQNKNERHGNHERFEIHGRFQRHERTKIKRDHLSELEWRISYQVSSTPKTRNLRVVLQPDLEDPAVYGGKFGNQSCKH